MPQYKNQFYILTDMPFQFHIFVDSNLNSLERSHKRDYSGYLNLSSNELNHTGVTKLYKEFAEGFSPSIPAKYPYYKSGQDTIAKFWNLSSSSVLLSPGSDEAIKMVMFALGKNIKRLILQYPNYRNYEYYARACGIEIQYVSYLDKDYSQYIDEFQNILQEQKPSLVVLTNPNGFTGEVIRREEISHIATLSEKFGHLLVIDEAYTAYGPFDSHTSMLTEQINNLIIIRSLSKSFGIAGLRIASVFGHPSIIDYLAKWNPQNNISMHSILCMEHCFTNYDRIESITGDIVRERERLKKRISSLFPLWKIYDSQCNFILVDTKNYETVQRLSKYFQENRIIFKTYEKGSTLETCFRATVAEQDLMDLFISNLTEWKEKRIFTI